MLRNAAGDRAVSMGFALAELPYFTLWKNLTALEEGYVTGLEPGTGFPYTRRIEREAGRVPKLKPGETRRFSIDVGLHTTGCRGDARRRADCDGSRTAVPCKSIAHPRAEPRRLVVAICLSD